MWILIEIYFQEYLIRPGHTAFEIFFLRLAVKDGIFLVLHYWLQCWIAWLIALGLFLALLASTFDWLIDWTGSYSRLFRLATVISHCVWFFSDAFDCTVNQKNQSMALGAIPEQGLHVASCFVHALFLTASIYHTAFSLRNPVRVPILRFDPHKHTVLSFRSGIAMVLTAVAFGEFVYQLDNKIYPDSTTTASPIYYADQILTILAWASNTCLTILMARNGAWLYFKVHTNMCLSNLNHWSFDSKHWSIDWLIDCSIYHLTDGSIDLLICLLDWLVD